MYQSLLEMEKKLDWTMTRKRVEVQDALARNPTVCPAHVSSFIIHSCSLPQTTRTLRVFVSHTVFGQPWQVGEADGEGDAVNFETGQGIPAWSLKVEGRLLEVCSASRRRSPSRIDNGSHQTNALETKWHPGGFRLSSRG